MQMVSFQMQIKFCVGICLHHGYRSVHNHTPQSSFELWGCLLEYLTSGDLRPRDMCWKCDKYVNTCATSKAVMKKKMCTILNNNMSGASVVK